MSTLDLETFGWLTEWGAAYQSETSARAWGLTQYLFNDKKRSKLLPAAMRDLAAAGAAHWEESEDDYEATTDIQLAILQKHFGEDVLERASKAFKAAEKKFR